MMLTVDLVGRVKNMQLPHSNYLSPLFEAIVNSIQSVQSRLPEGGGRVNIEVLRDEKQLELQGIEDESRLSVAGFVVSDNGVGFDEANFQAFCTCDTMYKQDVGGKGVGRFLWLKAFDSVSVHSVFCQSGRKVRREFDFLLNSEGVCNHKCEETNEDEPMQTRVTLVGYRADYERKCPKGLKSIAERIVEHCLQYFVLGLCPEVQAFDRLPPPVNLNQLFRDSVQSGSHDSTFLIGEHEFAVKNLQLSAVHDARHQVHYCAHSRVVRSDNLSSHIKDLPSRLKADDGEPFVYAAYVSGAFLDERVNADRTGFAIPDEPEEAGFDGICWQHLAGQVSETAESYLETYLLPARSDKEERIRRFVETQEPQFRHLLRLGREGLKDIPADVPDDRLYSELSRLDHVVRLEMRADVSSVLSAADVTEADRDLYRQRISELMQTVSEVHQSDLARYVVHRRAILDLLERSLEMDTQGRHRREEVVHSIIYPRRRTSDDLEDFEDQNLWIIDERLCYHTYLGSEKKMKYMPIPVEGKDTRPDIIVFNRRFAYGEGDQPPSNIVIIEFKRPIRDDYTAEDNPITQTYDYVRDIRAGLQTDSLDRPFNATESTRFYCYIVADLTPSLQRQADNAMLVPCPDGIGYFGVHAGLKAYVEVISFDKLVSDAKKRNRVLFEKLNLSQ